MASPDEEGWRDAYQSQITELAAQYKKWRAADSGMLVHPPSRRIGVQVRNLTDEEIYELSRREAEVDLNTAINMERASERHRKARAGEAL